MSDAIAAGNYSESGTRTCMHHKTTTEYDPTYDDLAESYDAFMTCTPYYSGIRQVEETLLRETLESLHPSRMLDLGCGTGYAAHIAAEFGTAVTGIDPSQSMLAVAQAKLHHAADRCTWITSRAEDLPRLNELFDLVVAFGSVINHTDNWPAFFSSISKNMARGAILLITVDNLLGADALAWAIWRLLQGRADGVADLRSRVVCHFSNRDHVNSWPLRVGSRAANVHLRYARPHRVLHHLRRAGFEIMEVHGANALASLLPSVVLSSTQLSTRPAHTGIGIRAMQRADLACSRVLWRIAGTYVVRAVFR